MARLLIKAGRPDGTIENYWFDVGPDESIVYCDSVATQRVREAWAKDLQQPSDGLCPVLLTLEERDPSIYTIWQRLIIVERGPR